MICHVQVLNLLFKEFRLSKLQMSAMQANIIMIYSCNHVDYSSKKLCSKFEHKGRTFHMTRNAAIELISSFAFIIVRH